MTFRLAHVSDFHIGPLPKFRVAQIANKRFTGYVNWLIGRRGGHDMAALEEIIADMRAARADHVAMSGDLVNIGLPDEFTLGRRWIEALGNPHDVSLIPGNHDAYVGESLPAMLRTFPDTMASDGEVLPAFPYLRARGGVALIGVTTGVPTGPFMATGRIGGEQAGKLGRLLENARSKGLARVVMIHHPPHFSGSRWGRRLTDAHIAEAVLARHGAELVIHGHNHRHSAAWINGPSKRIPVIGVGSASAVPGSDEHRAQWQLYTIEDEGEAARISVEVRCRVAPGRVETIREFKLGA